MIGTIFDSKADPKNWGEQRAFYEINYDKEFSLLSKTENPGTLPLLNYKENIFT